MNRERKFWDLYVAREIQIEDLHDYIDEWHESDTEISIYAYLNCTEAQYAILIRYSEHSELIRLDSDPTYALTLLRTLQSRKDE